MFHENHLNKHIIRCVLLGISAVMLWLIGMSTTVVHAQTCSDSSIPQILTTCYGDDPSAALTPTDTAIVRVPLGTTGDGRPAEVAVATYGEVGYTYGLAQDTTTNAWYASAVARAGYDAAGLPGTIDSIYVLDSSLTAGSALINTVSLTTLGFDVGTVSGPADYAKAGIGDIDIDSANGILYVMNIYNGGELIALDVSDPANVTVDTAADVPNPCGAADGEPRPWATKYDSGKVYVGLVCDVSIDAYVMAYDVASGMFNTSPVVGPHDTGYGPLNGYGPRDEPYQPWDDTYPVVRHSVSPTYEWFMYPQPLLTDIEIYPATDNGGTALPFAGDMVLAFGDRTAFAVFEDSYQVDPLVNPEDAVSTRGDLIHACDQGDGTWDVENGRPGSGTTCEIPSSNATGAYGGDGDGTIWSGVTGEGYQTEWYIQATRRENESALGAVTIDPNTGYLIATAGDPGGDGSIAQPDDYSSPASQIVARSSGFSYIDPEIGIAASETLLINDSYGKASALGDIEIGCIGEVQVSAVMTGSIVGSVLHVDGDPVPNATVTLSDGSTAMTDASGVYTFTNVPVGVGYTITVDPNSISAADGPDADPNDKVPGSVTTPPAVTVMADETAQVEPARVEEVLTGSLTGIVRHVDGDPVPNAMVTLSDGSTATTDASGMYTFTNVPVGSGYTVTVDPNSISAADGPDADPNDKVPGSVTTPAAVSVTDGDTTSFEDALVEEVLTGSLVGIVRHVDGDPVPNAMVTLSDGSTATTDASGMYTFTNVPVGSGYTVTVDPNSISAADGPDADPNDKVPGDVSTPPAASVTAGATASFDDAVVPEVPPGSVTGNVAHVDGDPIPNATVQLLNAAGDVVATAMTDSSGDYVFTDVLPGSGYRVAVVESTLTAPDGPDGDFNPKEITGVPTAFVPEVVEGQSTRASDIDVPETILTPSIMVMKTASIMEANVGDTVVYTYVVVNDGDVPLTNVTVMDDVLGEVTLDLIDGALGTAGTLQVGTGTLTHIVTEADLAGGEIVNVATATGTAPDDSTVMDTDEVTVVVAPLGSIGNQLWSEYGGNNTFDPTDPISPDLPLDNVTVILTLPSGDEITTTTDASGVYTFTNLPLGTYQVRVDILTLPLEKAGADVDFDPDGGDDGVSVIALTAGATDDRDQDFSFLVTDPSAVGMSTADTAAQSAMLIATMLFASLAALSWRMRRH